MSRDQAQRGNSSFDTTNMLLDLRKLDGRVKELIGLARSEPAKIEDLECKIMPALIKELEVRINERATNNPLSSAEIRGVIYALGLFAYNNYFINSSQKLVFVVSLVAQFKNAHQENRYHHLHEIANVISGFGQLAKAGVLPKDDYQTIIVPLIFRFQNIARWAQKDDALKQSLDGLLRGIKNLIRYDLFLQNTDRVKSEISTIISNNYDRPASNKRRPTLFHFNRIVALLDESRLVTASTQEDRLQGSFVATLAPSSVDESTTPLSSPRSLGPTSFSSHNPYYYPNMFGLPVGLLNNSDDTGPEADSFRDYNPVG